MLFSCSCFFPDMSSSMRTQRNVSFFVNKGKDSGSFQTDMLRPQSQVVLNNQVNKINSGVTGFIKSHDC